MYDVYTWNKYVFFLFAFLFYSIAEVSFDGMFIFTARLIVLKLLFTLGGVNDTLVQYVIYLGLRASYILYMPVLFYSETTPSVTHPSRVSFNKDTACPDCSWSANVRITSCIYYNLSEV